MTQRTIEGFSTQICSKEGSGHVVEVIALQMEVLSEAHNSGILG